MFNRIINNPYHILNISPAANENDIRNAYYKLVLQYHPDKNPTPEAEEKFKLISNAYSFLMGKSAVQPIQNFSADHNSKSIVPFTPQALDSDFILKIEDNKDEDFNKNQSVSSDPYAYINKYYSDDLYEKFIAKVFETPYSKNEILNGEKVYTIFSSLAKKYTDIKNAITGKSFLWRAIKEDCAPIYIFNTAHWLFGVNINDIFDDVIDNVLEKVDTVFTEVELNIETCKLSLESKEESEDEAIIYFLDKIIAQRANQRGKVLKMLENNEIRRGLGIDIDGADTFYKNLKEHTVIQSSIRNLLMSFTREYLTHISCSRATDLESFTINRNKFWMESILPESTQGKASLIVCGAMHSDGEYGLPNLLACEGYKLEPLLKKAPTPKSTLLRNLQSETRQHSFFKFKLSMADNGNKETKNELSLTTFSK